MNDVEPNNLPLETRDTQMEKITTSQDVASFYKAADNSGVKIWIDGGWSVDALLGEQIRPHKDMDIAIENKDLPKFLELTQAQGYQEIRRDNEWNFVLGNNNKEVDVHVFVRDPEGNIVGGIKYPTESLTGTGTIDGQEVRCVSAKYMVEFLAPWIHKWPEKYLPAVAALCEKFEIPLPEQYINYKK